MNEFAGQVIVERTFPTKENAEAWIAEELKEIQKRNRRAKLTVESHLWEST